MATAINDTLDAIDSSETRLEIQSMSFSAEVIDMLAAPELWHLGAGNAGSADFVAAWNGKNASGILVSIVDEGVNYRHVDLEAAYDTSADYDPRDADVNDAAPDTSSQVHGTRVAGLLAGDIGNSVGTVGGAQGATITGSYLRFGTLSSAADLVPIVSHQKNYDISNNSWGFTQIFSDNFQSAQFRVFANALQSVAEEGRDGLGTIMVVAAGNGKVETANGNIGDDSNFHNFTNSRFVIAVGAHDVTGAPASFSSPGTNVLLTAPGVRLLTTDGTEAGSSSAALVSGTSFAAPLVSSTVALMLAENPDLGYRDVQEILAISAVSRVDGHSQENGFGAFNGGGLMFDRDGGFGLLDAGAATALARNWSHTSTFGNEQRLDFSFASSTPLDGSHAVLEANLTVADPAGFSMDHLEIDLAISDANLSGLQIVLVSPDGTRSEIAENFSLMGNRTTLSFTFGSVASWGENPTGTWKLELTHATPSSSFSISQADVRVFGDVGSVDDTYYYTSSYGALASADVGRTHAVDTDGGIDTLNFAAGNQRVVLDLSGATASSFLGKPIHLDGTFENAIGTVFDDVITGSDLDNRLVGDFGNDTLNGGAGNDTLLGGRGDDRLNGGAGSDIIDGGEDDDSVIFDDLYGSYTVHYDAATATYSLVHGGDVDTVRNVEHFVFSDGTINVLADPDAIFSPAALTSVVPTGGLQFHSSASAGSFTMFGSTADDIFIVNSTEDVVFDGLNGGNDTVHTMVSYTLAAGQEIEILETDSIYGTAAINLTGNEFANTVIGNNGSNVINGGAGADVMYGFGGNDLFFVDNAKDVVIEDVGGGSDTVHTTASYALAAGQEIEILETDSVYGTAAINLTGNKFANTVIGNNGSNVINGGAGADVMYGFGGNDLFFVDNVSDVVIDSAGGGSDTVHTTVSYALAAGQEIEILETDSVYGTAAINLTGNEFANTIIGNNGNNVINGGAGADVMYGFGGNDIFFTDNANDVVIESAGGGNDTVHTSVSYSLAAGQEIEILETDSVYGTAAINLTGNEFANTVIGNNGANVIDGGAGADVMHGFGGNDLFFVDNANDIAVEDVGGGHDTVHTSVSYALNAGQEIEVLETDSVYGTAAINLTGNEFANTIIGNNADNTISGGAGNDVLYGFGGRDAFVFDTTLNASTNVDTIVDFEVANDAIRLDHTLFAALTGTGTLDANAFYMGTAAHDADDRIIYNASTGALTYDSNGSAAGGDIQFATLAHDLNLTNAHFIVA